MSGFCNTHVSAVETLTVTTAEAELFPAFPLGSLSAETVAVFVIVVEFVTVGALAVTVTVALVPATSVPNSAVTVLPFAEQLPTGVEQVTLDNSDGNVSVTETFRASVVAGALLAVIVSVSVAPLYTGFGTTVIVTLASG